MKSPPLTGLQGPSVFHHLTSSYLSSPPSYLYHPIPPTHSPQPTFCSGSFPQGPLLPLDLCDTDLSAWTPVRRPVIVTPLAESMCCPYREHGAPERTHDLEQRSGLRMHASICPPSRPTGMGSGSLLPSSKHTGPGCFLLAFLLHLSLQLLPRTLTHTQTHTHTTHTQTHTHMHTHACTRSSLFLGVALYPELRPSQKLPSVNTSVSNGSVVPATMVGAGRTVRCVFSAVHVTAGPCAP